MAAAVVASKPAPTLLTHRRSRIGMLADLGWLTATAVADAPLPCVVWAGTALAQGLLVPAQLWLTKLLVDALAADLRGAGAAPVLLWLGLFAASLLAGRVLGGIQSWARTVARERQGPAAQARVMQRAAAMDLATFEHTGYYDRVARVLSETEGRVPDAVGQVLGLAQTLPAFAAYVGALAILSPVLLAVALVATVPTVAAWTVMGQAAWGVDARFTRDRRLSDYYAGMLTGRAFAQEVRLYGLASWALERWSALFWRARNGQRIQALRNGTGLRAMGTASVGLSMVALWLVVSHGMHHASAGTYTLLFQSVEGIFGGSFQVAQAMEQLGKQSGFAAEYRAFFAELPPRPPSARSALPRATTCPHIRFENVTFTYPGALAPAVAGLCLEIRPGEKMALVGENSAGKTTLTKLLLGLYAPDAGRITLDGHDVREADPRLFSAVFQQFVRYQLTLAENVGIAEPDALGDSGRIRETLARARAEEVADALPGGLEALLGPEVGGTDLSGGQWQRLALARGLFRDPQVLVLDEPTAALDPLAELEVFRRFAELAAGRTAVLVSHRLGICRLADRIVVLSHGRVVEQGTHDTRLAAGGPYARMFEAQARWYA